MGLPCQTLLYQCCVVDTDEAFDDEELLELAQAGRSQTDQHDLRPWQHQQALTKGAAPSSNKTAEEQINTGQAKASSVEPGTKPHQAVSAAENAEEEYLELDDDELLELACGSLDPQQDGVAECKQHVKLTPKPPSEDSVSPRTDAGGGTTGESLRNLTRPSQQRNLPRAISAMFSVHVKKILLI